MKVRLRTIGILLVVAITSFMIGAGLFVYAGIYNVSALKQHTKPVYSLLEFALGRAVEVRADEIKVPDLNDKGRIRNGAAHYQAHCLQCHGAPGVAPHDLAYGMQPAPVNLVATAREWQAEEIYWVIKHGIKMSGMPAWEYRLRDEEMWDIVAFVSAMAHMSVPDYVALTKGLPVSDRRMPEPVSRGAIGAPVQGAIAVPGSMPAPTAADDPAPRPLAGNVEAGRRAMNQYLCATCHQIPGIVGASNHVGPPLNGIADRRYIGGIIANNPENMVRWLMNPQQFDSLSTMPDLGVTEKDARDITAYLYTLDDVN
ncbi:c-type cytochrome [Oxalobacteraceae bacterium R-40]|uniref:C-type cytochrome n=1 Tax=Keguizhuia sedimenti TaxID=3064264 RepID=A0ABU1BSZ1_9BURK|nr:c-type cytochrome [Oxalobacteraceae bacterium R-40]